MKEIFDAVNQVFDFVVPIADFLWGDRKSTRLNSSHRT